MYHKLITFRTCIKYTKHSVKVTTCSDHSLWPMCLKSEKKQNSHISWFRYST